MLLAQVLTDGVGYFGGAAVIVTVASVVSAYNQYRTRKYLAEIKKLLEMKP